MAGHLDRRAVQAAERTADALERIADALERVLGVDPEPVLDTPDPEG